MSLPKVVSSTTKIRFQDCDPFNHLNNGSYINYFINHREDQLIKYYDIDIYDMAKTTGISWVTGSNQIAYLRPAFLMETVIIESQLIEYNDSQIKVEMRMYDEHRTQLKAVLWSVFVHFNLVKQKRQQHRSSEMQLFEAIYNPIQTEIFEERIQNLKLQKALV